MYYVVYADDNLLGRNISIMRKTRETVLDSSKEVTHNQNARQNYKTKITNKSFKIWQSSSTWV
jgi:hypothetical protein